jgi:hypothetical protein
MERAFPHELGRRAEFIISVVEVATFGAALVAAKGKNTARQDRGHTALTGTAGRFGRNHQAGAPI